VGFPTDRGLQGPDLGLSLLGASRISTSSGVAGKHVQQDELGAEIRAIFRAIVQAFSEPREKSVGTTIRENNPSAVIGATSSRVCFPAESVNDELQLRMPTSSRA
jgi:hypothetical protein